MKQKTIMEPVKGLKLHHRTLDCGLNIYLIPMKGFNTSAAHFYTRFGGMDTKFQDPKTGKIIELPEGTAHFFEHKMFDMPDGTSAFDKFHKNGAYCNAATWSDKTSYLFYSTSKFKENLEHLLNYVLTPYYTDESVAKEQGIIGSEIKMASDHPMNVLFENLCRALYHKNGARISVIGTKESISKITKEFLYSMHEKFYHPSNMGLIITGNQTKKVFEYANNSLNKRGITYQKPPEISYSDEPEEIFKKRIEEYKEIPIPMYLIGFKNNINMGEDAKEVLRKNIICDILLKTIFSEFSGLYYKLYSDGVIDDNFSAGYEEGRRFGMSIMYDTAKNVEAVEKRLIDGLKEVHVNGLPEKEFNKVKNVLTGKFLRVFDDPTAMARQLLHYNSYGASVFDYIPLMEKITIEETNKMFRKHINLDNYSISIIKPKV